MFATVIAPLVIPQTSYLFVAALSAIALIAIGYSMLDNVSVQTRRTVKFFTLALIVAFVAMFADRALAAPFVHSGFCDGVWIFIFWC